MKKILQISLLLFLILPVSAQNSIEEDKRQTRNLIANSFDDIFSDMDTAKLSKYYTADFLLLENGEIWDIDTIKNYMKNARAQGLLPERINSLDFIEIKIQDKMAWVAYYNNAVFKMDNEIRNEMNWLESATAILTPDGWKLQMLHSTILQHEH
ncbi:DUF4440 domain-containing protein [Zunongwangia sp. F363]|uniref:DUF4440 domain-containing protein n=1 Tax=Autumnicola tepida TaxID=3075595 RepID=A0ABU3C5A1_9FLAO|nr:DUF4440 domain-containing protein [Zunongwangia sp. F363]MDT0641507.1 DUF4440 domain-containing protein [Zunongwangia sp. F363]